MSVSRRKLLVAAAAAGGAGLVVRPSSAEATTESAPTPSAVVVTPADPRYEELTLRGFNSRFAARPESVRLVHTRGQVAQVVQEAVAGGKQLAVRGGGHGMEKLVDNPDVRLLIDMTEMRAVGWDPVLKAFAVEAGAKLQDVYKTLVLDYDVVVPGGVCPTVGIGGHTAGGGYGPLCRRLGAIVDHLYAVEVAVVDADGTVRLVVATREAGDPNRDLWWAHTGGGGGNFGVVTRYWFRSPGSDGSNPSTALPRPPAHVLHASLSWPWATLDEASFNRLLLNHGRWHEANSAPSSPFSKSAFQGTFAINRKVVGSVAMEIHIDGDYPDASGLLDQFVAALTEGVTAPFTQTRTAGPWLRSILAGTFNTGLYQRSKSKGAYLRRSWTPAQVSTLYRALTDPGFTGWGQVILYSYGGQANAVAPGATAMAQRDSILKAFLWTVWTDPAVDDINLTWIRSLYRDLYASTGGVPVPDDASDGSYINYPDLDLLDPAWNTSGVPWSTLFYKDNYARLQSIKRRYDPRDVFRHPLSVRLPG